MISRKTIDEIYNRTDIVEVVSEFVSLHKVGANYKGLCPFHNERTPSFFVSPSKGFCKCFSCGAGGNVIHFLMEHESLNYPEAIRWLAKKYNIEIEEKDITPEEIAQRGKRESLFVVNEWVNKYYKDNLFNSSEGQSLALTYFRNRGLRDDIIEKYQLGYSLQDSRDLPEKALKNGFKEEYLLETGVCGKTQQDKLYDRYHGRVIYPIQNVTGRIIGFGGRTMLSSEEQKAQHIGKYVNSPQSEVYDKSKELYGLFQAKNAIKKKDCCYMVEGYMDVISMYQSGIENVVSSSGTSLTLGQIRLLRRFTNNITVLYDGDSAGIKASLRGIDMLLEEGMNIKVLLLPDGDDPDSFARKYSAQEYQEYMESHQEDFISFKTRILLNDIKTDPQQKSSAINDIVNSISLVPDNITRSIYIKDCSDRFDLKEEVLTNAVGELRLKRIRKTQEEKKKEEEKKVEENIAITEIAQIDPRDKAEKDLLYIIIRYGMSTISIPVNNSNIDTNLIYYVDLDFTKNCINFANPNYETIWNEIKSHYKDSGFSPIQFLSRHEDIAISKTAMDFITDKYQLSERYNKKDFEPTATKLYQLVYSQISRIKFIIVSKQCQELQKEISTNYNSNNNFENLQTYQQLIQTRNKLAKICGDTSISY